jgi:uncharacterized membrane protein YhiD involved in acid resistance
MPRNVSSQAAGLRTHWLNATVFCTLLYMFIYMFVHFVFISRGNDHERVALNRA